MWSLKRIPPIHKLTLCVQFLGDYKVFLNYLYHINLVALKVNGAKASKYFDKIGSASEEKKKKEPKRNVPVENVLLR